PQPARDQIVYREDNGEGKHTATESHRVKVRDEQLHAGQEHDRFEGGGGQVLHARREENLQGTAKHPGEDAANHHARHAPVGIKRGEKCRVHQAALDGTLDVLRVHHGGGDAGRLASDVGEELVGGHAEVRKEISKGFVIESGSVGGDPGKTSKEALESKDN